MIQIQKLFFFSTPLNIDHSFDVNGSTLGLITNQSAIFRGSVKLIHLISTVSTGRDVNQHHHRINSNDGPHLIW